MAESNEERIARLLAEGLDQYGIGDVAKAILAWEEVLVLDPNNTDARDYIKTADRRKRPRPPADPEEAPAVRAIASEVRQAIERGQLEEALEMLRSAVEAQPASLELQGNLDLVRARLLCHYRETLCAQGAVPSISDAGSDITKFNLPPDAGFLLSQVDGMTSVPDLVSLSGMDDFEALRLLRGLCEAGILELSR